MNDYDRKHITQYIILILCIEIVIIYMALIWIEPVYYKWIPNLTFATQKKLEFNEVNINMISLSIICAEIIQVVLLFLVTLSLTYLYKFILIKAYIYDIFIRNFVYYTRKNVVSTILSSILLLCVIFFSAYLLNEISIYHWKNCILHSPMRMTLLIFYVYIIVSSIINIVYYIRSLVWISRSV